MRAFGWAVVEERELDAMAAELAKLRDMWDALRKDWKEMLVASPLTEAELLEGLRGGPDDPVARSMLAVVRALKELALRKLRLAETKPDEATILRGHLMFAADFEQMVLTCWGDLKRKKAKGEEESKEK